MPRAFSLVLAVFLLDSALLRADEKSDLAVKVKQIFTTHCYRCHGESGTKEGGFDWVMDLKKLVGSKVVAGEPTKSRLFKRLSPDLVGDMPFDEKTKPTADEIEMVRKWIAAGAPEPPAEKAKPRPFVALKDELAAMQKYLRKCDRDDRRYVRFFSLRHLHNMPPEQVSDAGLRSYRAALSKLINSLSRKKTIVVPGKADDAGTVYAVNIRDLDWDRRELWSEIVRVYPYGLNFVQYPDNNETRDLADEVYGLAGTKVPVIRVDWFIASASRPPLYHTLLQLPMTARELEREQDVMVNDNIRSAKAKRAGFNASGVSSHNRLVERHDSVSGAYWKSYDFKNSAGRGNLFVFPLGPKFAGNAYEQNAFEHAGGEIIFSLPNGLQGYLLVNDKDERINEGPVEIVNDDKKTANTPAVVNGLSCMSCHDQGMRDFKDQVRDGHILGGDARDFVKRLYPDKAEMDKLLERDRKRFLAALDEACGPFLKVGGDEKKEIESFPEPITPIAKWYLTAELTLEDCARELGLDDPKVLKAAIDANPRLQERGLYPLAHGNRIKREVWEDTTFFYSPFHETARELKLGVPERPR